MKLIFLIVALFIISCMCQNVAKSVEQPKIVAKNYYNHDEHHQDDHRPEQQDEHRPDQQDEHRPDQQDHHQDDHRPDQQDEHRPDQYHHEDDDDEERRPEQQDDHRPEQQDHHQDDHRPDQDDHRPDQDDHRPDQDDHRPEQQEHHQDDHRPEQDNHRPEQQEHHQDDHRPEQQDNHNYESEHHRYRFRFEFWKEKTLSTAEGFVVLKGRFWPFFNENTTSSEPVFTSVETKYIQELYFEVRDHEGRVLESGLSVKDGRSFDPFLIFTATVDDNGRRLIPTVLDINSQTAVGRLNAKQNPFFVIGNDIDAAGKIVRPGNEFQLLSIDIHFPEPTVTYLGTSRNFEFYRD